MRAALVIALLFGVVVPSSAAAESFGQKLVIGVSDVYDLGYALAEYEEQGDPLLTIDQITSKARDTYWSPVQEDRPSYGFSDSTWWFRFTLESAMDQPEPLYLISEYPLIDELQLFILQEGESGELEVVGEAKTGDKLPFTERAVQIVYPNFKIETEPGQSYEIVLRLRTQSAVQVPLMLYKSEALTSFITSDAALLAMYFGFMIVMALYNLMLFVSVRDPLYGWYVAYVVVFATAQASLTGVAFQYLWPDSPWMANPGLLLSVSFSNFMLLRFSEVFLRGQGGRSWLPVVFKVLYALVAIGVVVLFVAGYRAGARVTLPLVVLTSLTMVVLGLIRYSEGYKPTRFFIVAWGVLVSGVSLQALGISGVLESNWLVRHAAQVGSALEVVLLAFALADRIKLLDGQRDQALAIAEETKAREKHWQDQLVSSQGMLLRAERLSSIGQTMISVADGLTEPTEEARTAVERLWMTAAHMKLECQNRGGTIDGQLLGQFDKPMDQARESLAELAAVTRALNELQATAFDLDYGVDMRQLADAAIKELEEQYPDYQIATHLKEVPAVACHQEQLYQLLLGIMSNSLAALEQMAGVSSFRGRLRVTLGPSERHGEQGAALLVSDNANDVSLEAREAFYEGQSADGLAGMGLSVAFAGFSMYAVLAKEIGGHFQVDADNGIRYELWLPAQSDKSSDSLFNF